MSSLPKRYATRSQPHKPNRSSAAASACPASRGPGSTRATASASCRPASRRRRRCRFRGAGHIEPDRRLRGSAVTIRLDKLRVADYPGTGIHRILFDFYARNALEDGDQEHLHYNATFRAAEGQEAAALGLPIFVDLNVGDLGLAFRCLTVNVANEGSEKALDVLESDLVRSGLELAKQAQPAIGPLSQIAVGLTKSILGVNRKWLCTPAPVSHVVEVAAMRNREPAQVIGRLHRLGMQIETTEIHSELALVVQIWHNCSREEAVRRLSEAGWTPPEDESSTPGI